MYNDTLKNNYGRTARHETRHDLWLSVLQKGIFQAIKGILLPCDMWHIAIRLVTKHLREHHFHGCNSLPDSDGRA